MNPLGFPWRSRELVLIGLVLGGACRASAQDFHELGFVSCRTGVPAVQGLCGSIPVPEDWTSPQGRTIHLHVMILRARRMPRQPDPFLVLVGGPGQAASEGIGWITRDFAPVLEHRDIVLADLRGTGRSEAIQCRAFPGTGLQRFLGPMYTKESIATCLDRLEKTVNLSQYKTPAFVRDLDAVRVKLGYSKINLYGTSYGTRLAMAYMKEFPGHVRTATLEAVFPTNFTALINALDSDRSLKILLQQCGRDPQCGPAFPRAALEFQRVLTRLADQPAAATIRLQDGSMEHFAITRDVFAEVIRSLLYAPSTARLIPLLIHRAAQGQFETVARAAIVVGRVYEKTLSHPVFLSVACSELMPNLDERSVLREARSSFVGESRLRMILDACGQWPAARLPEDFSIPLETNIPILLLSGWLDPAAPSRWAEEASLYLPDSLHLLIREGHHNFSGMTPKGCVYGIVSAFVARGSINGLDVSCAQRLRRPPFALTMADVPAFPIRK